MPITDDEAMVLYVCDYKRRGMCDGSQWCVGNGGPCRSTVNAKFSMLDGDGNPIIQDDPFGEEVSK